MRMPPPVVRSRRDDGHARPDAGEQGLAERDEAVGQVYNVGTGRRATVGEIAELLIRARGARLEPEIVSQYRAGDIRHCYADVSRIERDLGFRAQVTLEEGMDELLQWLETQAAEDRVDHARAELEKRGLAR